MPGMNSGAESGGARDFEHVRAVKIREEESAVLLDGLPAILLEIALPEIIAAPRGKAARAPGRVNAFYNHMRRAMDAHARRCMLRQASGSLWDALARSRPFEPYRVKMRCGAAISGDGTLTVERFLYVRREPGDERGRRFTEIWDLKSGFISRRRSEAVDYPPRPSRPRRPRRGK